MATYDMTSKDTTGVSSNSIATLPTQTGMGAMRMIQAYLDIDALVAAGYSGADGDIFQLIEIPAGTLVLFAGAEVEKAFTGSCTLDMDFAAGDDMIDGADITSTGFCAEGTNGQSNDVTTGAASLFTQFQSSTDTIDCKIAGAAPATGRLRAYACVIDCNDLGASGRAADVDRDQLA
tara:strand:- start:2609 stop:3139 length:531 start_codon:yes stop_codon:yes gene_type:complete